MMLDEDKNSGDNVDQDMDEHGSDVDVQPMRKKARKSKDTTMDVEDV